MTNKTQIKKWYPKFDIVFLKHMEGKFPNEIAEELGRSLQWVTSVINSELFQEKSDKLIERCMDTAVTEFVDATEALNGSKLDLVKEHIRLALHGESESIRAKAGAFLIERFAEFAPKNVPMIVQNTQINQLSKEDIERNAAVAAKLEQVAEVLREGNPNILDLTTREGIELIEEPKDDDTSGENTDTSGGDPKTQG